MLTDIRTKMQSQHNRKQEITRFLKFAAVGSLGFLTHFTIVNILVQVFGMSETIANPFGFVTAVVQNFVLNRHWTFPESRNRNPRRQLIQFSIVSVLGLLINQLVFFVVHTTLESWWIALVGNVRLGHALSYNFALCVAVGVVLFWNFTANRLWTYRGLNNVAVNESGVVAAQE